MIIRKIVNSPRFDTMLGRIRVGFVIFVVAVLLALFCKYSTLSHGVALALGTVAIIGVCYAVKSCGFNTVTCACGGKVTPLGGYGPCSCRIGGQLPTQTTDDWEQSRTGMHN